MIESASGIVDSHVHAHLSMYEPVESLLDQMFRHRVDQAILIQCMGEPDNRYLVESAMRFPGRFTVGVCVDETGPDAPAALARWAETEWVRGIRMRCNDPEPLWKAANELGLAVSLAGRVDDIGSAELRARAERYPNIKLCVEHLGHPDPNEAAPFPRYRAMLRLAELENVYLKVSGFYSFTKQRFPYDDTRRFADLALEAFGPRRMMWASDFPPVSGHEGYHNALAWSSALFGDLSAPERAAIMGDTARSVWWPA